MKNAEQRAGFEIFCRKSRFFKYSLSKSTKYTPKLYNLFTVWFPKELVGHNFHALRSQNCSVFTSLPFQRYWELAGAVQTQYGRCIRCPLSYKEDAGVAQSWSNRAVDSRMFWYGFVINHK